MSAALSAAIQRLWAVASKAQPTSRPRFLAGDVRLVVSELSRRLSNDARAAALLRPQEGQLRQDCATPAATPGRVSPEGGTGDDPAA